MGVILIIAVILSIIALVKFIKYTINKNYLLTRFKENNVIVSGRKGKGKDLLFQYVINKRHDKYYANIDYGKDYEEIAIKDISLEPNTYEAVLNNIITKVEPRFEEKKDIYLSDIGNALPSQYDYLLHKNYKSLPLYYSLSRHIAEHNIHGNAQNFERIWKPLREQADTYIVCKGVKKYPFILRINLIVYEKYETALKEILPMKKEFFNKQNRALYNQFEATNGKITSMHLYIFKRKIYYDTRAFKKVFIKEP